MALSTTVGTFQTGTGAVASTTAVTGLGFQPKFVYFCWNGRTETSNTTGRASYTQGWGFAAGSSDQRSATSTSVDAGASSDGGVYATAANCICTCDPATGAATGLMALQSFDAGGFTLVVNDVMPASLTVQYWAIGGTTLTNVVTGLHSLAASTTGNVSVTGLAFQPDFGMFICVPDSGALPLAKSDRGVLGFGAALSASKQFVYAGGEDDSSATMDTGCYIYDGECIAIQNVSTPTSLVDRATFVSWNSDGYTVNVLEKDANVRRILYAVFKGAAWDISGITTQTDTTTDMLISGLTFTPKAGMVVSANRAKSTQDTGTTNHQQSFGLFSSDTNRSALGILDRDGVADAAVSTSVYVDEVYINLDNTGAVQGLMDVKYIQNGGVRFIMDDADPSGAYCAVITVGEVTKAPPPFQKRTHVINRRF